MQQLQRGNAPKCLNSYKHGTHNWSKVTSTDKQAIWTELDAMQGQRCAYCEGDISNGAKHIEHFRQKGRDPQVTFLWSNLFGSCNRQESCGKHKDRCGTYSPADLIKPDVEDPERYLVFSSDGTISPRQNQSEQDRHRATETIRIFNLNGALRQIRCSEVMGYIQTAEYIAELSMAFPENEWLPLLHAEIATTTHLPFATAIKHVLTRQG